MDCRWQCSGFPPSLRAAPGRTTTGIEEESDAMVRPRCALTVALLVTVGLAAGPAYLQDRDTKVRNDRAAVGATGLWVYNDLSQAIALARKSAKPLLAIFPCVP
jgi:hypothetical protein